METSRASTRPFTWQAATLDSSFSVEFPKAPEIEMTLVGAELSHTIEEHDILVLHFKGHPILKQEALVSGDPVKFSFRSQKLKSTWYGYIYKVTQPNTYQGGNTDIICIGASYLLKETDQKVYTNVTADQVVNKLAAKHSMTAVTQRHPRQRDSIVQAGQSDWQLAKRLARQTGFVLRCENTTIFFVSKDKIYSSKKMTSPYFFYVTNETDGIVPREARVNGTILSFTPHISDSTPEAGVRVDRVVTGVNANKGTVIKAKHLHKAPTTIPTSVVVPNETFFLT
jgi:hypothetical protein